MINKEEAKQFIEKKTAQDITVQDFKGLSTDYQKFGELIINSDYRTPFLKNYLDIFGEDPAFNPWDCKEGLALAKILVGDVLAVAFKDAWDLALTHSYQWSYYRRSFRSIPSAQYTEKRLIALRSIQYYCKFYKNLSFKEILQYDVYSNYLYNSETILAAFINQSEGKYLNLLEDIINNEDDIAGITRPILKALLQTNDKQNWELVGKLLLAAQRQEGLRQTILECLDDTHVGALEYMIDLILEHDLARFSSVVRAIDTWFGFNWEAEKKKTVQRVLELVSNLFKNPNLVENTLESKDNLEVYCALWFIALQDVDTANKEAFKLIKTQNKQKTIVSCYFISQTGRTNTLFYSWIKDHLHHNDLELNYWLINTLLNKENFDQNIFNRVLEIAQSIPKSGHKIVGGVFHWMNYDIQQSFFYQKLIYYSSEEQKMILAEKISDLPLDNRYQFVTNIIPGYDRWKNNKEFKFIDLRKIPWKRNLVHQCITDRDQSVMQFGINVFKNMPLEEEEFFLIEDLLGRKNKSLRKELISTLLVQKPTQIQTTVSSLLDAKKIDQRLAGLEILSILFEKKEGLDFIENKISTYKTRAKFTKNEEVFLDKFQKNKAGFGFENGFGVIDYSTLCPVEPLEEKIVFKKRSILNKLTNKKQAHFSHLIDENKIENANQQLQILLKEKANEEYNIVYGDDYTFTEIFSNKIEFVKQTYTVAEKEKVHYLPFADTWINWYKNADLNDYELAQLIHQLYPSKEYIQSEIVRKSIDAYFPSITLANAVKEKEVSYLIILQSLFHAFADIQAFCAFKQDVIEDMIAKRDRTTLLQKIEYIDHWDYKRSFTLLQGLRNAYPFYLSNIFSVNNILFFKREYQLIMNMNLIILNKSSLMELARDYNKVDRNLIYSVGSPLTIKLYNEEVFKKNDMNFHALWNTDLIGLTEGRKINYIDKNFPIKDTDYFKDVKTNLLELEMERGEMATEASVYMQYIIRVEGYGYFLRLIERLGKETLERGYSWGNEKNRKIIFSSLIKKTHPKPEEKKADFIAEALQLNITKKRWIELALYAPQWANWISEIVEIKSFESSVWFFHAHASDYRSAEKETIIARYSQVNKTHLDNGAIDISWFNSIYPEVGKSNWKLLTDACKYISYGNGHRQIKMYSEVILGEVRIRETLKKIKDKRDKISVKALGLIPLSKTIPEKDLLTRYNLLQEFLKESKQFGAQRQESEKLAVEIGLENLSRNAGFEDSIRFSWSMEAKATEAIMENALFEDGNVRIELMINEHGEADILVEKAGKKQKSIPAKYKKEKSILQLKEGKTYLKKQYSRTRVSLENAMLKEDVFTMDELNKIMVHPIVKVMLSKLVLFNKTTQKAGFWKNNSVFDIQENEINIDSSDSFIIAHPSYLHQTNLWDVLQKYLFEQKIVQPFKQVFRELYVITDDEIEKGHRSVRYQGHQIQVKKTVALLRSRGWTLNYETGLQKVFHKKEIGAQIYAEADWYSSADVEAPTIEHVSFYSLKTYREIPLKDIDPVTFSEIMRDVDLVVSVAHVGDVDPEASHSTMEMRSFLAKESARLFKLNNVEVKARTIIIKGAMSEYSIHLGSGMVQSKGMQLSIIAVQSQHRGRVFLPFIDSDPKSAEIISKMKLLAEDSKIKDPTILSQIMQ
ncbi:MAG: DUF5724 domain-containing protein [Polaribacter sp.]